jgi:hypothetical protein
LFLNEKGASRCPVYEGFHEEQAVVVKFVHKGGHARISLLNKTANDFVVFLVCDGSVSDLESAEGADIIGKKKGMAVAMEKLSASKLHNNNSPLNFKEHNVRFGDDPIVLGTSFEFKPLIFCSVTVKKNDDMIRLTLNLNLT